VKFLSPNFVSMRTTAVETGGRDVREREVPDSSVPSETSLSLLSSVPTATPVFCNPSDLSRVIVPLMVIVVALTSSNRIAVLVF
jgi:hypothetical protein